MQNVALEKIRKSRSVYISAVQAANVLGFAYIKLIEKLRDGKDVGFVYEYESDKKCYIPREEFIISVENWKWTSENIKMLSANFLTIEQAANAIGCAERTLRSAIKKGKPLGFEYFQMNGIYRIHKKSFLNFIEGGANKNDGKRIL